VAYADVIVINKTDLVDEEELQKLEERINDVNILAPRIKTQHSKVPLESVRHTSPAVLSTNPR
jgi:G3E family GTPase